MSDDAPNTVPPQNKRGLGCAFKLALLLLVLFFLFIFLSAGIGSGGFAALIALTFGWLAFLQRTVPQITWNWDLVGMALFCSVAITLLGHKFSSWFTRSIASKRGIAWQWPWRWTFSGLAMVGLLFLVGMSVGGAAHQMGWIAGSQEPWFERKPRYLDEMMQLRELEMEFRVALMNSNTIAGVRQALRSSDAERRSLERRKQSLVQSFHILLVSTNRDHVDGIVLFPRSMEAKSRLQGYFVTEADSFRIETEDLPKLLREQRPHLIAF